MAARGERLFSQQLADGQFYGDVQSAARSAGLVLSELAHPEASRMPAHSHQLSYFTLVLDGHYEEGGPHHYTQFGPYTMIFNPAGAEHESVVQPGGASFFTVELERRWMDSLGSDQKLHYSFADMNAGRLLWLTLRLRQEHATNQMASALTAESLVWEMLGEVTRWHYDSVPNRPAWWTKVEDSIRGRFAEKLSFAEIARDAKVHPVHLARTCRRVTGRTLGEYVQALRLRYACELMKEPDIPLAQVAFDSGFADQSHLTRMFQRFVHTTPKKFRATLT